MDPKFLHQQFSVELQVTALQESELFFEFFTDTALMTLNPPFKSNQAKADPSRGVVKDDKDAIEVLRGSNLGNQAHLCQ